METVTKCSRALWQFIAYIRRRRGFPLEIIFTLEILSSLKQLLINNNNYKSDLIFQSFYLFPWFSFCRPKCLMATNTTSLKSCYVFNITPFTSFLMILYYPNLIASSLLNFMNIYIQKWVGKLPNLLNGTMTFHTALAPPGGKGLYWKR